MLSVSHNTQHGFFPDGVPPVQYMERIVRAGGCLVVTLVADKK